MAKQLESMSVDDLTAEIVRLSNEREALRDEQKRVSDVRDRKLTEQATRERLLAAGFGEDAIARINLQDLNGTAEGVT